MRKFWIWGLGLILLCMIGCNSTESASPTPVVISTPDSAEIGNQVRAEGVVEPLRSVTLRAESASALAEIVVTEGDVVGAGDVLLRFDTTDADLTVQQAEAAVLASQARLAMIQAGPRSQDVAILEAQLRSTEAVISQVAALRQGHYAGGTAAGIAEAQVQLAQAEAAHQQAQEAHRETMRCYDIPQPDGSIEEICPALGTYEELTRYQEHAAYAGLLAARANLEAVRGLSQAQGSERFASEQAAIAQRDVMLAQLALLKAGNPAGAIAAAEAEVRIAEAALETARAMREQRELRAPFAGVVTGLSVRPGEATASGDPLLTLATLDSLRVRTQDLTELDVARIEMGQPVALTIDARPDRPLLGRISRIDRQSTLYLGDVVYPVVIAFEEPAPPWVRWGMTVQIETLDRAEDLATLPVVTSPLAGDRVIAEAVIEPARWSNVSFVLPGKVSEVLVSPGERVTAGQELLRLDDTRARLAVQEAEAALRAAQAQLLMAQTAPREEAIQAAEAHLAVEANNLAIAQARYRQLTAGGAEAEVAAAQARLNAAQAARREKEVYLQWAEDGGDTRRVDDLRREITVIDQEIAAAEAQWGALPGITGAQLRAAHAGIAVAQAQYDVAQAQLELARSGSTAEEIALAEASVRQAEVALATAETALERTVLYAPFAGMAIKVLIEEGSLVASGQPLVVLATLDQWQARTTDLQELAIAQIEEGQTASVSIDALPDITLNGTVTQLGMESALFMGDTTYPVVIVLEEGEHNLYWGMSAIVDIAIP